MEFRVDSRAQALAAGGLPATWGLNFNAFAQGATGDDFRLAYIRWRAFVSDLIPEAYVYPWEHLHITVAPPAPFTHTSISSQEEKVALEEAWLRLMMIRTRDDPDWPRELFPLSYDTLQLDGNAGIFLVGDPLNCVSGVRNCIDRVAQHVEAQVPSIYQKSHYRRPSIVHTTVLRWISIPGDDIMARWKLCVEEWKPQRILTSALTFVRETIVYQHEPKNGEQETQTLIHSFPYTKGGGSI